MAMTDEDCPLFENDEWCVTGRGSGASPDRVLHRSFGPGPEAGRRPLGLAPAHGRKVLVRHGAVHGGVRTRGSALWAADRPWADAILHHSQNSISRRGRALPRPRFGIPKWPRGRSRISCRKPLAHPSQWGWTWRSVRRPHRCEKVRCTMRIASSGILKSHVSPWGRVWSWLGGIAGSGVTGTGQYRHPPRAPALRH